MTREEFDALGGTPDPLSGQEAYSLVQARAQEPSQADAASNPPIIAGPPAAAPGGPLPSGRERVNERVRKLLAKGP